MVTWSGQDPTADAAIINVTGPSSLQRESLKRLSLFKKRASS